MTQLVRMIEQVAQSGVAIIQRRRISRVGRQSVLDADAGARQRTTPLH